MIVSSTNAKRQQSNPPLMETAFLRVSNRSYVKYVAVVAVIAFVLLFNVANLQERKGRDEKEADSTSPSSSEQQDDIADDGRGSIDGGSGLHHHQGQGQGHGQGHGQGRSSRSVIPSLFSSPSERDVSSSSSLLSSSSSKRKDTNANENTKGVKDMKAIKAMTKRRGKSDCAIYTAPSSLGGKSGYGLYTTVPFRKGTNIRVNDGPNIPVIDPYIIPAPHLELFDDRWWAEQNGMGDAMRFEAAKVTEYAAMFGALPNYHPWLSNLFASTPNPQFNDEMLNRTVDPGAGAFSPYLGKNFGANRYIEAGEELFLDYGEGFLHARPQLDFVPRMTDYEKAGRILVDFLRDIHLDKNGLVPNSDTAAIETALMAMKKAAVAFSERAASLLPSTVEELEKVVATAGSLSEPEDLSYAVAREISTERRSIEWIEDNGICLDNIEVRPSTIRQAGHGAFAKRKLSKGQIIIPVPLLHILDGDILGTFPIRVNKEGHILQKLDHMTGNKQLLVNYCFGHTESTLLLCPLTNVGWVNHCSIEKGECGHGGGPNAFFRWTTDEENQKWLRVPFKQLMKAKHERILSFELIATRDIREGEEIFIDYGSVWEHAWDEHVKNWKPPPPPFTKNNNRQDDVLVAGGENHHQTVTSLNEQNGPLEVTSKLRDDRSPRGDIMTGCWYWGGMEHDYDDDDDDDEERDVQEDGGGNKNDDWRDLTDFEILSKFGHNGAHFTQRDPTDTGFFWPCSIVERNEDEDGGTTTTSYTVRIFPSKTHRAEAWARKGVPLFLTDYPRSSVKFFPKPYRSDQHLPGAFRHHIGIPDEIFPSQWKNRMGDDDSSSSSSSSSFAVGDRIEVKWGGEWWEGCILRVLDHDEEHYSVLYDDGSIDDQPEESIRPSKMEFRKNLNIFYS